MRPILFLGIAAISCSLRIHAQLQPTDSQSKSVYIPAFVENKNGKAIYDIPSSAFSVEDNGVARPSAIVEDFNLRPVALVVVIRTGRSADEEIRAIQGIGGLLNTIVSQPQDRTAIIAYDGKPQLVQELTADPDATDTTINGLRPGDTGAALYDALHLAVETVKPLHDDVQKVILIVGGARDHGSNLSDLGPIFQEISGQNAAVYSLAFPPPRTGVSGDVQKLNPLAGASRGGSAAQSLAQLTGGNFYEFKNAKNLQDRMLEIGAHFHGRYVLRMDASGTQAGFHTLRVQVQIAANHRVVARSGYFVPPVSQIQ